MASRRRGRQKDSVTLADQRLAADIRQDIHDRVGGDATPTKLSRETIVAAILELDRGQKTRAVATGLNERKLRIWLADLCDLDYHPGPDRGMPYRRDELQRIDETLENGGPVEVAGGAWP